MSIAPGTRLGAYEIARDTRLQRDVAIKVLPPAFASDPDRLARFGKTEITISVVANWPGLLRR